MADNKSKSNDNAKGGAKATPAKTAQALNQANAEAEKIKADAIAEAEKIVAGAKAEAEEIESDAKGEAGDIIADAKKEAVEVSAEAQADRDKDDLSRGESDLGSDLQPYRNEGTVNLFTEAGRCNPNKTVMLTVEQAGQYKGLVPCNTANE